MADPDQLLKPVFNYSPSATVLLLVGKHEEEMLVHADCLTARSEFFAAALSKAWKEGQTRTIKLPEDDPATAAQYLDFCYHNYRLPTQQKFTSDQIKSMFFALARLYVFGERVLDSTLRDATINQLITFSDVVNDDLPAYPHYPGPKAIEMVYEGTTEAAPMRKLLVDMYVRLGSKEWLVPELHPAFCQDVAREFMRRAEDGLARRDGAVIRKGDYVVE